MTISKLRLSAIALAIIITTLVVVGISSAQQFGFGQGSPQLDQEKIAESQENHSQCAEKRQEMEANHEAVIQALDNNDYQSWLEAVGADSPMGQAINEDEFPRLIEAHLLIQESKDKMQQAKEIHEELGLPGFPKGRKCMHKVFNQ